MAPNQKSEPVIEDQSTIDKPTLASDIKLDVAYSNAAFMLILHVSAVYGLYLGAFYAYWTTLLFNVVTFTLATIGAFAGAHRLWSHRSYKATMPLQVLLMLFHSLAFQWSIIHWVRDHRLHHRYSDTDADPHNPRRGIFYSHFGWMMTKKHPEVKKRGKEIDMSDILANPVLTFQKKYAIPIIGSLCFVLPTLIPVYFWQESLNVSWHVNLLRYAWNINVIFLINSIAHAWGYRPYDKNIRPTNNRVINSIALGEGQHNYHHVFPWDYRSTEVGDKFNLITNFIDLFAKIGWAYDLKAPSDKMVDAISKRAGDGTNMWGEMRIDDE